MPDSQAGPQRAGTDGSGTRGVVVGVVGPTGSGKTELSIVIACRFDGEVVSCDALQIYRGLDIGTGKVDPAIRESVPHHLLDVVGPDEEFSAADYVRIAAPIVRDLDGRGKLPLVVGGTGLYLRALVRGLFDGPGRAPALRARLTALAERHGAPFVHGILARLDPVSGARIHPNDRIRSTRALEVSLLSGTAMSEMMKRRRSLLEGYRFLLTGLAPPRELLARKIRDRVEQMFRDGFVDEVRGLLEKHGWEAPAFKAIGYREVARHLSGELSLAEARDLTLSATLHYAKRQVTWFRREPGVVWFAGHGDDPDVRQAVTRYLESRLDSPATEGNSYAKAAS